MDNHILADQYLEHYGVKGMKWGVRNNPVRKQARKDVAEKAKADAMEGRGSGNRRKAINSKIKESKADDLYKIEYAKAQKRHSNLVVASKVAKLAVGMAVVNAMLAPGSSVPRTPVSSLSGNSSTALGKSALSKMEKSAWDDIVKNYDK